MHVSEALIVLAKTPRRGAVKTRLVPPLDDDEALRLYRAMLRDTLALARRIVCGCPDRWAELRVDRGARGLQVAPVRIATQGDGDLGARLTRAFADAYRAGARHAIAIGADSPTLPDAVVEAGFAALRGGSSVCVAPANDGGYVLVGVALPAAPLFDGIPWSTAGVLQATRAAAQACGAAVHELDGGYDVDDREGLTRLRDELGEHPERAPATARCVLRLKALR